MCNNTEIAKQTLPTIERQKAIHFACNIIEMIEGMLEEHGIEIPNKDREEYQKDLSEGEEASLIFGEQYYSMEDDILQKMKDILEVTITNKDECESFDECKEHAVATTAPSINILTGLLERGYKCSACNREWTELYTYSGAIDNTSKEFLEDMNTSL